MIFVSHFLRDKIAMFTTTFPPSISHLQSRNYSRNTPKSSPSFSEKDTTRFASKNAENGKDNIPLWMQQLNNIGSSPVVEPTPQPSFDLNAYIKEKRAREEEANHSSGKPEPSQVTSEQKTTSSVTQSLTEPLNGSALKAYIEAIRARAEVKK